MKSESILSRRLFLKSTAAAATTVGTMAGSALAAQELAASAPELCAAAVVPEQQEQRTFLTPPSQFGTVSRGSPTALRGEQLTQARLTPESWRLEITSEAGGRIETPLTIACDNAVDLPMLERMGRQHGRKYLKAMQCMTIAKPLGQGLWEGVPLREVLKLVGRINNVRRVYFWGWGPDNDNPDRVFKSSLSYTQVMDCAPNDLVPLVAYRLNGQPIPLVRGGPVRMVVPWTYGFKSIKWLQRIMLTNEFRGNDDYARMGNDPESFLKTAAYIDGGGDVVAAAGQPVVIRGTVMVGLPGLKRVEYWLREVAEGQERRLADNDPAWRTARWQPCTIEPPPQDWGGELPNGVLPRDVWGFDAETGLPKEWPMRYSWALWSVTLHNLKAGIYQFRPRSVDQNDIARPEPRPIMWGGRNEVQMTQITIKEQP